LYTLRPVSPESKECNREQGTRPRSNAPEYFPVTPFASRYRRIKNQKQQSSAYNVRVARSQIQFLKPWYEFLPGQGEAFLEELKHELSPGHLLESLELVPLGHSGAADDAIFEAEDGRVFRVHLTLSHRAEQPPLPRTRVYANANDWARQVMLPANEEYRG
jgi:hypothetical protein